MRMTNSGRSFALGCVAPFLLMAADAAPAQQAEERQRLEGRNDGYLSVSLARFELGFESELDLTSRPSSS
jgi:hypothetical protein